jgi:hypothetical protein
MFYRSQHRLILPSVAKDRSAVPAQGWHCCQPRRFNWGSACFRQPGLRLFIVARLAPGDTWWSETGTALAQWCGIVLFDGASNRDHGLSSERHCSAGAAMMLGRTFAVVPGDLA